MLSPVSLQSFEFNDKGFVIKVDDDKICFTKDGVTTDVYFNCLYNKTEVDNLIAGGGGADPNYLRNICLSAINIVLKGLSYFDILSYSETSGELNIVRKDVQHTADTIYELFLWLRDTQTELSLAHNSLHYDLKEKDKAIWDKINTIHDCHCMDAGGFHDQVMSKFGELDGDIARLSLQDATLMQYYSAVSKTLLQHNMFVTLPAIFEIGNFFIGAYGFLKSFLYKFWAPSNKTEGLESTTSTAEDKDPKSESLVDPSQEIANLDIPLVDDPYKREFDENKPIYGTLTIPYDLQVNGLINGIDITDIKPGPGPSPTPGESNFNKIDGYDYFYVKNENVDVEDFVYKSIDCHKLAINGMTAATINKLKSVNGTINVLRFILRKNEVFDDSGTFIKEFYCYVEDKKLYCPVITLSTTNSITQGSETRAQRAYAIDCIEVSWSDKPFIAFDKKISFEPYILYLQGELSIMYLLPQDTIESTVPEIKCDIITARNALKLHESNVAYLYKPTRIYENNDNYIMTFHIDQNYTIPTNMTFTFSEFIFMNIWTLTWTGNEWVGDNIQGRTESKMKNAINRMADLSNYIVIIGVEKNDFNKWVLQNLNNCDLNDYYCFNKLLNRCTKTINGKFDNGEDFTVKRDGLEPFQTYLTYKTFTEFEKKDTNFTDYYIAYIAIEAHYKNQSTLDKMNSSYLAHVASISLTVEINSVANTFTFKLNNKSLSFGESYLRMSPDQDTADTIGIWTQACNIDKTSKDVTLHLKKESCIPRKEISWDKNTNPFQFIIDQQFYSITPNPNAATTLYTDFNITSSKIITADNITTMRSDLNVVANTTDVISFDVKAVEKRCDNLEVEVTEVKTVVDKLKSEMNTLKVEEGINIGLSIADTLLGVSSLVLAGNAIKMGKNAIRQLAADGSTVMHQAGGEAIGVDVVERDIVQNLIDEFSEASNSNLITYANDTRVDIRPIYNWVAADHVEPKFSDEYATTGEDDSTNPNNIYVSYSGVHRVCMNYRDSLKPGFKLIADKFTEIDDDVNARPRFSDFVEYSKESPEIIFSPISFNQRILFKFNYEVYEGSFEFRVTWSESGSDWDDLKIVMKSKLDENKHRIGYEITEFSCTSGSDDELKRYVAPHFDDEGRIELNAVNKYYPDQYDPGDDIFGEVQLLKSDVTVLVPQQMENLVYKDVVDALDERVKKLEKGGNLTSNEDIERRLAILEAKCKNIIVDDEVSVQSETTSPMGAAQRALTVEERLQILERKCANINI